MRVPIRAVLGPRYAKQPVGYRVLSLDRVTVAPFTTAGVTETRPGDYSAVIESSAGGFVIWGTEAGDIAEANLSPMPAAPDLAPLVESVGALRVQLRESTRPQPAPVVTVDTTPFEVAVTRLRDELLTFAESERQQRAGEIAGIAEGLRNLDNLTTAGAGVEALTTAAARFTDASTIAHRLIEAGANLVDLADLVNRLRAVGEQIAEERRIIRESEQRQRAAIAALDKLLEAI